MTLVTVVVIGHALPLFRGDGLNSHIYDFIYYWHIPAFVLITGYLSRSFAWSRRHLWALFCTIVVPYFIFETAMMWFRVEVGGEPWLDNMYLNPHWPMWYLAAVFLWRLATPILKRHWVFIPLSVAASLLFPLVGSTYLDLNRTIGLLPFFVVGLHLRPSMLTHLKTRSARVVAWSRSFFYGCSPARPTTGSPRSGSGTPSTTTTSASTWREPGSVSG